MQWIRFGEEPLEEKALGIVVGGCVIGSGGQTYTQAVHALMLDMITRTGGVRLGWGERSDTMPRNESG